MQAFDSNQGISYVLLRDVSQSNAEQPKKAGDTQYEYVSANGVAYFNRSCGIPTQEGVGQQRAPFDERTVTDMMTRDALPHLGQQT